MRDEALTATSKVALNEKVSFQRFIFILYGKNHSLGKDTVTIMERKVNNEELTRESKENKVASENRSNDGNKQELESKINNDTGESKCENSVNFMEDCTSNSSEHLNKTVTFKKPTVLISPKRSGLISKIPKTLGVPTDENTVRYPDRVTKLIQEHPKDPPFPYIEPSWSGQPEKDYKIEVLKSGVIVETFPLTEQSFYIIGRLPSCHVSLAHPTVSRYHAILQYRSEESGGNCKGFYIYDLGSTHGTFWNGNLVKPYVYVRVQGGHMLRFGCSQRKYILQAPFDDREEESSYTVSELKVSLDFFV